MCVLDLVVSADSGSGESAVGVSDRDDVRLPAHVLPIGTLFTHQLVMKFTKPSWVIHNGSWFPFLPPFFLVHTTFERLREK